MALPLSHLGVCASISTFLPSWHLKRYTSKHVAKVPLNIKIYCCLTLQVLMARRGFTILGGVSDPGHQCHCVTMATGMHWLLLFSVSGWEQLRSNHSANTVVNANIKRSERVLLGEAASFHWWVFARRPECCQMAALPAPDGASGQWAQHTL